MKKTTHISIRNKINPLGIMYENNLPMKKVNNPKKINVNCLEAKGWIL